MDVRHFNRNLVASSPSFEDVATGDTEAMFTLDSGFEKMGVDDRAFVLVPGVLCQFTDDGVLLNRSA